MFCKICGLHSNSSICNRIVCRNRAEKCVCDICLKKVPTKYKYWHVCSDSCYIKWSEIQESQYNNAFSSDFKLTNMNTRPVFIRPFSSTFDGENKKCGDCGRKTNVIVYELNGEHWGWCGQCSVGG